MTTHARVRAALSSKGRNLPEALRGDVDLILGVRQSDDFAVELASALIGVPFVRVTNEGAVDPNVLPWCCTALEAARLVTEMRGKDEDPQRFMEELQPYLLLRNTATVAEDHINRLGWRVW